MHGDALTVLCTMESGSVNCCVTSPPYWGLRDYGVADLVWGGESGHEHTWGKLTARGGEEFFERHGLDKLSLIRELNARYDAEHPV